MSNNSPTFRLFRKIPGFFDGIASSIDFFSDEKSKYKIDMTEREADLDSIYSDWQAVGNDIKKAMKEHGTAQRRS